LAINIDDYLKDIDPQNICGDDLQYDPAFIELEQAIKGKPEQQIGEVFTEAEPPNWREIKKYSEALLSRTIDLRILVCYLRALTALDGFSGLQDGLTLITAVVEKRWDSIHPQLDPDDDNDPTERVNILLTLCDNEAVLRPLQQVPLLESKSLGRFNFRDISIAAGKTKATSSENETSQSTIDAAVQDVDLNDLQQNYQAIAASLECINQLENLVTDYVGVSEAPSFGEIRSFLKECKTFLTDSLEKKGVESADQALIIDEDIQQDNVVTIVTAKSVSGVINNNQDVLKTLNLVCDYYRKNEPSSPIPLLIERAIRLVGRDFMDVLKDLAPAGIDEAKIIIGKQDEDEN